MHLCVWCVVCVCVCVCVCNVCMCDPFLPTLTVQDLVFAKATLKLCSFEVAYLKLVRMGKLLLQFHRQLALRHRERMVQYESVARGIQSQFHSHTEGVGLPSTHIMWQCFSHGII